MTYHDLSECTLNADERRTEADKITQMISETGCDPTEKEIEFLDRICEGGPVSVKQLFWLRDIKDKYL